MDKNIFQRKKRKMTVGDVTYWNGTTELQLWISAVWLWSSTWAHDFQDFAKRLNKKAFLNNGDPFCAFWKQNQISRFCGILHQLAHFWWNTQNANHEKIHPFFVLQMGNLILNRGGPQINISWQKVWLIFEFRLQQEKFVDFENSKILMFYIRCLTSSFLTKKIWWVNLLWCARH